MAELGDIESSVLDLLVQQEDAGKQRSIQNALAFLPSSNGQTTTSNNPNALAGGVSSGLEGLLTLIALQKSLGGGGGGIGNV